MPTGVAGFCAKAFLYAIHISQGRKTCFEIQLTALCQVCLCIVVFESEQRRATLDLGLDDAWGSDFSQVLSVESTPEGGQQERS